MPLTQPHKSLPTMKTLRLILLIFALQGLNACAPIIVAGTVAGAGATIAADRRSIDKVVEDQVIEIQATDFIYSNKTFGKAVHISVTSFNGTVLLAGETLDLATKQRIIKKIKGQRGVKKVIDAIKIKQLASATDRSHDTWITGKVKSHIIAKKGLLTRSKVITSNDHVYLMGIVNNQEAKQLINIVKNVKGVTDITPLFESQGDALEANLSADAHIKPIASTTTSKPKLNNQNVDEDEDEDEDEDVFTVQHYVIQPAVRINKDENE